MLWKKSKHTGQPVHYRFRRLEQWQGRNLYMFETLDPQVSRIYNRLARLLNHHAPVLLRGESGCGKEVLAQALYHGSPWSLRTLLVVNCETVMEAQLPQEFAHALAAMPATTGTNGKPAGIPTAMPHVTVLLKNVAALSPTLQLWCVQLLQEKVFRMPASEAAVHLQVRFLATSLHDLAPYVAQGQFRQDLYYRLSTYEFVLPPLRERKADLPGFVAHFSKQAAQRNGRHEITYSENALAALMAHTWPGNIRELENTLAQTLATNSGRAGRIEQIEFAPTAFSRKPALSQSGFESEVKRHERALEISTA